MAAEDQSRRWARIAAVTGAGLAAVEVGAYAAFTRTTAYRVRDGVTEPLSSSWHPFAIALVALLVVTAVVLLAAFLALRRDHRSGA